MVLEHIVQKQLVVDHDSRPKSQKSFGDRVIFTTKLSTRMYCKHGEQNQSPQWYTFPDLFVSWPLIMYKVWYMNGSFCFLQNLLKFEP